MDRICADSDYDFAEPLLRSIIPLSQALRSDNPHARFAAANYFRESRYLLDAIWPEFKPQIDWLLSHASVRVN